MVSVEASPFVFDGPVPPDDVVGRDAELAAVWDRAVKGRFVLLYAPRRFGKTSLIRRVEHDAAASRELSVIVIDLLGVQTVADIARRMEQGYRALPAGPLTKAIRLLLAAAVRSGLQLTVGGASLRPLPPDQATPVLEVLLRMPWEAAGRADTRVLVVLDEFQAINDVPGADAILRSQIQHQRDRVSYLFSGSEHGMLRAIFQERARPLYGQAERIDLGPLPADVLADFVTAKFQATGRDPGEALEPLLALAEGHPQRAAFLADQLWHATPPGATADLETFLAAEYGALRVTGPEFAAATDALGASQRRLLRVLAWGEPPYGAAAGRLGLAKSSATSAVADLRARSLVGEEDPPRLVDPLYAAWLRRRYDRP